MSTANEKKLAELLGEQADWLAPARSWLLRQALVGQRRRILDLGAGYGAVTGELARRGGGRVVALDIDLSALSQPSPMWREAGRVAGDGRRLPFPERSFDLIFCQCVLMWIKPLAAVIAEISRVLQPGGALVALEPDYGGMIEHPPEIALGPLWEAALERAGADPRAGRRLPRLLAGHRFDVRVNLFSELGLPEPSCYDFLRTLPLTGQESAAVNQAQRQAVRLSAPWDQIAHLPFFLISSRKK